MKFEKNNRGSTFIELSVVMGITVIIGIGASTFLMRSFRDQAIISDQLQGQKEGRRIVSDIINIVRTAEESSIGGYPIAQATTSSLTIYANVDNDALRERIRYWLEGTRLKKGILKPSGNPLSYTGVEQITTLSADVRSSTSTALFEYFKETYAGTSTPMTYPLSIPDIRMVRVKIEIERDITKSPVPLFVESITQIRNLKTN